MFFLERAGVCVLSAWMEHFHIGRRRRRTQLYSERYARLWRPSRRMRPHLWIGWRWMSRALPYYHHHHYLSKSLSPGRPPGCVGGWEMGDGRYGYLPTTICRLSLFRKYVVYCVAFIKCNEILGFIERFVTFFFINILFKILYGLLFIFRFF